MKRLFLLLVFLALASCGGGGGSSVAVPSSGGPSGTAATIGAPSTVSVVASPSTITVLGTTAVTATVKDKDGNNVPDGTIVRFTDSNAAAGTITPQAKTVKGQAVVTFTARNTPGTVTVTATAGSVSGTVNITIQAAAAGSIEFVSAVPQVIGIAGTGQTLTSTVTFVVKDVNGNPVSGQLVSFSMNGPGGGEFIQPTSASTDAAGEAVTFLHSGSVAGPVTIIAQVTTSNGSILSTSSSVISIGGGLPSATHFNLATSVFNLPGLVESNAQATISAFIADRFGNFNVLTGTSVSYYAEAGAIDRSALTNDQGIATSLFRTQAPYPAAVKPTAFENALCQRLSTTYGLPVFSSGQCSSGHPRNGWATILSTVQGEEAFLDENGNGSFDLSYSTTPCPSGYSCECDGGQTDMYSSTIKPSDSVRTCPGAGARRSEAFIDLGEPFIDMNDDGCRNDGTNENCNGTVVPSTDPFEPFIDADGNSVYDGPNGVWDGPGCNPKNDPNNHCQESKMISTPITIAFTGNANFCAVHPTTFKSSSSTNFSFAVGDQNLNALIKGTTIGVSSTGGSLSGTTSFTLADAVPLGPAEIFFTLTNPTCTKCDLATPASITITVTPPAPVVGCTITINGSILGDSPTPTPPPTPAIAVTPASASLSCTAQNTATFTVTGGVPPYKVTETVSNSFITTNPAMPATITSSGGSFSVTANACGASQPASSSASFTVSDSGGSTPVTVPVTLTNP